jgi:hypothetical protein
MDSFFDSLPKESQDKMRAEGYRPYRELPRTIDSVFPVYEQAKCFNILPDFSEFDDAPGFADEKPKYTQADMVRTIRTIIDHFSARLAMSRCPSVRNEFGLVLASLSICPTTQTQLAKQSGITKARITHKIGEIKDKIRRHKNHKTVIKKSFSNDGKRS